MLLATQYIFTAFACLAAASPLHFGGISAGKISQVFQFGYPVQLENLAIRPNGHILATEPSPAAQLWEIVPCAGTNGTATAIAHFNTTTALGIAQIGYDTYAITTGNVGSGFAGQVGSFSVSIVEYQNGAPVITKVIPLPNAKLANKLTALDPPGDVILVSDPESANILSVNVVTGEVNVALSDSATMGATSSFPIGVNGIQTVGNTLYYINTSKGIFNRVAINSDGTAAGPYQTITNYTDVQLLADDFAIKPSGQAFLAGSNVIVNVQPNGTHAVIAGNEQSSQLAGATSALFGHGSQSQTLFVTFTGKISAPATSGFVENGGVIAIEVNGLW